MKKIRTKIIISFVSIIVALVIMVAAVFAFHLFIAGKYKQLTDNLILESSVTTTVPEFIDAYYLLVSAPSSGERLTEYVSLKARILGTLTTLDGSIVDEDSKRAYRGLKNMVLTLVSECDRGLELSRKGDFAAASSIYNEGLNKKFFVAEATSNLMINELRYAEALQGDIDRAHALGLALLSAITVIITAGCIIISVRFANRLTAPLARLSSLSSDVAQGNLDKTIETDLTGRDDELGILSDSLNKMIAKLRTQITSLETANQSIKEAGDELKRKNAELETFNKFAVGRELRMKELKSDIELLSSKIKSTEKKDKR